MNKSILLGDCHFGCKDGSPIVHRFFDKCYTDFFFIELNKRDIKTIYQLGDLFDKRRGVDSLTISESKRYFFDKLVEYGIELIVLLGNHDIFYKESLQVNSPEHLLIEYKNVTVINKPTKVNIGSTTVDIIPWICRENYEDVMKFIQASESDLCFGHFEIEGFAMYKGVESHGGLTRKLFSKYKHVYSGHYHTRSTDGNITYVGTPYEMTWSDWGDPRGFHILDGDTQEVEFITNPFTLHEKLLYNEDNPQLCVPDYIKDKFVKVIVEKKTNIKLYDKYIEQINKIGVLDLKLIEDFSEYEHENVDTEKVSVEDAMSFMIAYIDETDTDLDKSRLKNMMHRLYIEAQELQK